MKSMSLLILSGGSSFLRFNFLHVGNDLAIDGHLAPLQPSQQDLRGVVIAVVRGIRSLHLIRENNSRGIWSLVQYLVIIQIIKDGSIPYAVHYITARRSVPS